MSQVRVSGNASGTGIFTVAAPNTNTNYTLTLPTATGTLLSTASAGTVLQVLTTTTTTLVTNSSATYASTGLSLNITPSSATSKILVMSWCPIRYGTNNGGGNVGIRINRASGTIVMNNNLINNVSAIVDISYPITLSYLDSPATTSSTNYTIEFALVNSSGVYSNPTVNWNSGVTQTSTLTLMEIAA
jgi:hypothetical protein